MTHLYFFNTELKTVNKIQSVIFFCFNVENLSSYIDDDQGEGQGFEMGMKLSEEQSLYSDLDENFDPLQYDAREVADMKNRQNCDISLTKTKHDKTNANDASGQVKDNVDPCEEEDEEEDDFVQKGRIRMNFVID